MLRQLCRRGRFKVNTCALKSTEGPASGLAEILFPAEPGIAPAVDDKTSIELLAQGKLLSDTQYNIILLYLRSTGEPWHSYVEYHQPFVWHLPRRAIHRERIVLDKRTYNCRSNHFGNSAIHFRNPRNLQSTLVGAIDEIRQIPLLNVVRTFFLVRLFQPLPPDDHCRTPYATFPEFESLVVEAEPSADVFVIEPQHIVCHLTTDSLAKGTFGIDRKTIVICWALNRGQR